MIRIHVIPAGRAWAVRILGETIATVGSSVEGEIAARRHLEASGGGEIILHHDDRRAPKVIAVRPRPRR